MSLLSIAVLALSLSIDAFLVAVSRGSGSPRPRLGDALRTGLVFGAIEAATPVLGWAAGIAARSFVESIDHWIAFGLLGLVGVNMIVQALRASDGSKPRGNGSLVVLLATAVGTSIDAFAVGISLAFIKVNIVVVALAIGCATFALSTAGMLTGRFVGVRFGRFAEAAGGIALIGIGGSILYSHLSAA
ncbi:manganese efflux pump MntP family protein [Leptospira sp. severe_002]|uniref:manganese efflux pump MntP n=1 Tax=Leptospira sp. severe_002 TaxID=2838237 RepID=UPI001E519149|nr:manganese efflux pump MntP family protein [Leptospira sp. severe_002]